MSRWRSHWLWLPTLYLTRGLPYVILLMTSLVYFNRMGFVEWSDNTYFVMVPSSIYSASVTGTTRRGLLE